MLRKVSARRGMSVAVHSLTEQESVRPGLFTRELVYNYPLGRNANLSDAPTYTTVTERWEGMNTPPAVTRYRVEMNPSGAWPPRRRIEATRPDGTRFVQLLNNEPGNFADGLLREEEIYDAAGTLLQRTEIRWEQGDYKSPRRSHVEVVEKLSGRWPSRWRATGYTYGTKYNRLEEIRQYDYGVRRVIRGDRTVYDGTVLRRVRTEYEDDRTYALDRHILYLPKVVEIYEGESVLRSRTEYTYDSQPLLDAPDVVGHLLGDAVRHLLGWNPYDRGGVRPSHEYRGNLTEIKVYGDASNRGAALSETRRYDITGNLRSVSGSSCCEQESFEYTKETEYAYPTTHIRGAADPASPATIITSAKHDFNTSLLLEAADANGRRAEYHYDTKSLRLRSIGWPTTERNFSSPLTTYIYADEQAVMYDGLPAATEMTKSGPGPGEPSAHGSQATHAKTNTWRNGLGLVVREEILVEDGQWNAIEKQYDALGRLWKETPPFRKEEDPQNELKHWTELAYDALGRVTVVRAPDGSEEHRVYDKEGMGYGLGAPSSCRTVAWKSHSGPTVLARGADGRERWMGFDALGRPAVAADPDPESAHRSLTTGIPSWVEYDFDALDRVTKVERLTFGCEDRGWLAPQPQPSGPFRAPEKEHAEPAGPGFVRDPSRPADVEDPVRAGELLPTLVWTPESTMLYGRFAYDLLGVWSNLGDEGGGVSSVMVQVTDGRIRHARGYRRRVAETRRDGRG